MTSSLLLKALDEYSSKFQGYNHMPLEWDKKTQAFKSNPNPLYSVSWYFNFFVIVLGGFFCCWFVLLNELYSKELTLSGPQVVILIISIAHGAFGLSCFVLISLYNSELSRGWNQLFNLTKTLRKKGTPQIRPNQKDHLGSIMLMLVQLFALYPILLTIFAILLNFDPVAHILNILKWTPCLSNTWVNIIFQILRFVLTLICCQEVYRLVVWISLGQCTILLMSNSCLLTILQLSREYDTKFLSNKALQLLIKEYRKLALCFRLLGLGYETGTSLGYCSLFVLSILYVFASLTFFDKFPLAFYLTNPAVGVAVLTIIHALFPYAYLINERSAELLNRLGQMSSSVGINKRYRRSVIRSLSKLRIVAGVNGFSFFWLSRSAKCTFYQTVFNHTINLLMSVPQ